MAISKSKTESKLDKEVKVTKKMAASPVKKATTVGSSVSLEKKESKKNTFVIDLFDTNGKVVGEQELSELVFNAPVNNQLISQAVRVFLANQRQGTAKTKSRGEVVGSTRKIYRQKGTGRARHGGIRAPLFVGGGVTHGPNPRDYSLSLPQKMKQKALSSALSAKLSDKAIKIVLGLEKLDGKTKVMAMSLRSMQLPEKGHTLLVINDGSTSLVRAARNIERVNITSANRLNVYDVLTAKTIIFSQEALPNLEKRFERGIKA